MAKSPRTPADNIREAEELQRAALAAQVARDTAIAELMTDLRDLVADVRGIIAEERSPKGGPMR